LINLEMQENYKQGNSSFNEKQQLSESTKLENRFLPVKDKQQEPKRKAPKHTFSFGNYDEHHLS